MLSLSNVLNASKQLEKEVCLERDSTCLRRYYRFRASKHYRGSAVADVIGCNLGCAYCWCWRINRPPWLGFPEAPRSVIERLLAIARPRGYSTVRLSGGEPTLCFNHLLQTLECFNSARRQNEVFVLETNGLMLALDRGLLETLVPYRGFLHVRVSLKGCSAEEFSMITGVEGSAHDYQIRLLEYLEDLGIAYSVAIPISFCTKKSFSKLLERLGNLIGWHILSLLDFEILILYPSTVARLCRRGLRPWIAVDVGKGLKVRGDELEKLFREQCRERD